MKLKTQFKFTKLFVAILLAIFVVGKSASFFHSFSHGFFTEKSLNKNCEICAFANFQKQTTPEPSFDFAFVVFLAIFLAQKPSRIESLRQFSDYFSQAPPR